MAGREFVAVKLKINLLEAALRRCFDRIFLAIKLDVLCAINEGLTPDADQNILEVEHGQFPLTFPRRRLEEDIGDAS
jgi:hypothetical protein